jgi:hypothetical protein
LVQTYQIGKNIPNNGPQTISSGDKVYQMDINYSKCS